MTGPNSICESMALNQDNVLVTGADNGHLNFYDWESGHCFQQLKAPLQPGSLESESSIFGLAFDKSGTRLISAECDKSIKIWQENPEATPFSHPVIFEHD